MQSHPCLSHINLAICMTVLPREGSQNYRTAEEIFVKFNIGELSERCLIIQIFNSVGQKIRTLCLEAYMHFRKPSAA
jgi:hypothetical protein